MTIAKITPKTGPHAGRTFRIEKAVSDNGRILCLVVGTEDRCELFNEECSNGSVLCKGIDCYTNGGVVFIEDLES